MRFSFNQHGKAAPNVVVQASRESVVMSGDNVFTRTPHNVSYPQGWIKIDKSRHEVYGWNDERQEYDADVGRDLTTVVFCLGKSCRLRRSKATSWRDSRSLSTTWGSRIEESNTLEGRKDLVKSSLGMSPSRRQQSRSTYGSESASSASNKQGGKSYSLSHLASDAQKPRH